MDLSSDRIKVLDASVEVADEFSMIPKPYFLKETFPLSGNRHTVYSGYLDEALSPRGNNILIKRKRKSTDSLGNSAEIIQIGCVGDEDKGITISWTDLRCPKLPPRRAVCKDKVTDYVHYLETRITLSLDGKTYQVS
jgi:hypothetical protein